MKISTGWLLAGVAVSVVACADRARGPESVEVRFERVAAYRQACAARVLAERAQDDLETLTGTFDALDPDDPISQIASRTTGAALSFGRAYNDHAQLRATAYAYLDSAVNHSATAADSVRYIDRAGRFSIRLPAEGTVEANVFTNYQENLAALLSNPDHPCNWDIPF
jgi:hypothetical protein